MQDLFNPGTWLECDINEMSKKEFIDFCRKTYDKAHNIEKPSILPTEKKRIQAEFRKKITTKLKEFKDRRYLQNLSIMQEIKRLTNMVQSISCRLVKKPYDKMTNSERDALIPVIEFIFKEMADYLVNNEETLQNWKKDKENFNTETGVPVTTLKKYINDNLPETDEMTLRTLVAWLKKTLPTKRVPVGSQKTVQRYKEYYSKNMVTAMLAIYTKAGKITAKNNKKQKE